MSVSLLQQRGERDSQNQAVLTKLKCAAGMEFSSSLYCLYRTQKSVKLTMKRSDV